MKVLRLLRGLKGKVMRLRARCCGVDVDSSAYLARVGKYEIFGSGTIKIAEGASIFGSHRLYAQNGASIYIGGNVHFEEGARLIAHPGACIHIGDGCWFNHDLCIVAGAKIVIGENCLFGPGCYITDHNHGMSRRSLIKNQPYYSEPLEIGGDVWMGVGATLVQGAKIGQGAVIAARAVVNQCVPEYEVWGGIPARRLGVRTE